MLINKNFTILFLSTLVSGIGTDLTARSVAWVIQQLYNDFNALMLLNTLGLCFALILLPKFSIYVDKYAKTSIAKVLLLVGFVVQVIFLILNGWVGPTLWLLLSIGITSSLLNTLEPLNRIALAKSMTRESDYASTTQFLELMQQLMSMASAFIGMLVIQKTKISYVLIADALTFLIAFIMMFSIKDGARNKRAVFTPGFRVSSDENPGVNAARLFRATFYFFGALTLIPYICIIAQRVIYPAHFEQLLHATSLQYSLYSLPYSIGAILAISSVRIINKNIEKPDSIFLGLLFFSLAVFAVLLWPTLTVTYIAFFIFAFCHCLIRMNRLEILMRFIPTHCFGRINGQFQIFSSLMIMLLSYFPALIMSNYGVTSGWLMFAITALIPVLVYNQFNFRQAYSRP